MKRSSSAGGESDLKKLKPNEISLVSLGKDVLEIICSLLPADSLHNLLLSSKQFSWIRSSEKLAFYILKKYSKGKEIRNSGLFDRFRHESVLAGWILNNYESS